MLTWHEMTDEMRRRITEVHSKVYILMSMHLQVMVWYLSAVAVYRSASILSTTSVSSQQLNCGIPYITEYRTQIIHTSVPKRILFLLSNLYYSNFNWTPPSSAKVVMGGDTPDTDDLQTAIKFERVQNNCCKLSMTMHPLLMSLIRCTLNNKTHSGHLVMNDDFKFFRFLCQRRATVIKH